MRDPFYRQIVTALEAKAFDPSVFERCMCDLLRDPFPGLVPISGGSDAGMDGAIADGRGEPFPLVCTTDDRVIRNLTRSLKSYVTSGGQRRQVVLATSVALTPPRIRNLEKRARELGFTLCQIFEQRAIADRLFYSDRWTSELLGLSWRPQALTSVPRRGRAQLEIDLIGRDRDVEWLRATTGDRLIAGQPGSGKTFLLWHLARNGWGLFLDSDDVSEIRSALIEQRPDIVIVDDAHEDPRRLGDLRQLRHELRLEFAIVATCWSGERDVVAEALGSIPEAQIRNLELLTADQIVEVFRQTGLKVRDSFMRFLRKQAANKPGLAVTLATLCLRGSWNEVLSGEALARSLMTDYSKLVGKEAADFLAVLGLGGDQGLTLETAGEFLELGFQEARRMAIRLATGGVVSEVEGRALAVRPEALRSALIRRAFFEGPGPTRFDYREVLERAPSFESAVAAIITAASYGAEVSESELRGLLKRCRVPEDWQLSIRRQPDVWQLYSDLGEDQARWALENYPGDLRHIASRTLWHAPRETIPRLLERAARENAEDPAGDNWPLDLIAEWTQELSAELDAPGTIVARRRLALVATRGYLKSGGAGVVAIRVLRMVLSPVLLRSSRDPGMGRTITTRRDILDVEQLSELLSLWSIGRELIEELDAEVWTFLNGAAWDWSHPDSIVPMPLENEYRQAIEGLARQVVTDLAPLAAGRPGSATGLNRLAKRVGLELGLSEDPVFEILYPEESFDRRKEQERAEMATVQGLARRWVATRQPREVAEELLRYEAEAETIGHRRPRRVPEFCNFLAEETGDAARWVESFLDHEVAGDLLRPFLKSLVAVRSVGWEDLLTRCLESDAHAWDAVRLVLRLQDPPARLFEHALSTAAGFPQLIEALCQREEVPVRALRALLAHQDPGAALAAAVGAWNAEPEGLVQKEIRDAWRRAILRSAGRDTQGFEGAGLAYWLQCILSADSELAFEWLERFLDTNQRSDSAVRHIVEKVVDSLGKDGRLAILDRLEAGSTADWLLPRVVSRDLAVFRRLLELERLCDHHLRPLAGRPESKWISLARFALEKGKKPRRIALAAFESSFLTEDGIVGGGGQDYWARWDQAFADMEGDPSHDLREVARYGREHAQERIRKEAERWRQQELDGF